MQRIQDLLPNDYCMTIVNIINFHNNHKKGDEHSHATLAARFQQTFGTTFPSSIIVRFIEKMKRV